MQLLNNKIIVNGVEPNWTNVFIQLDGKTNYGVKSFAILVKEGVHYFSLETMAHAAKAALDSNHIGIYIEDGTGPVSALFKFYVKLWDAEVSGSDVTAQQGLVCKFLYKVVPPVQQD